MEPIVNIIRDGMGKHFIIEGSFRCLPLWTVGNRRKKHGGAISLFLLCVVCKQQSRIVFAFIYTELENIFCIQFMVMDGRRGCGMPILLFVEIH